MKNTGLALGVILAAMALPATPGWATVIDHFVDGVFDMGIGKGHGPGTADVTSLASGTMLGGWRLTTLHYDSGETVNHSEESRVTATSHALIWEEGDSIKGTLSALYNANGAGLGTGSGVDVTDSNASSQWLFGVLAGGGDGSRFDVTITVTDISNATKSFTGTFAGFGTFALPFSAGVGSADLMHVKSIQYMFDSAQGGVIAAGAGGGDYTFDLIGTGTPEPATMALLATGAAASLVMRRRQQRRAGRLPS